MQARKRKEIAWLGCEIKTPPFGEDARKEAGRMLGLLQEGFSVSMPAARVMPSLGARCLELRIRDANVFWRILVRVDEDFVVVGGVFPKKTEKRRRRKRKRFCGVLPHGTTPRQRRNDMDAAKRKRLEAAGWKFGDYGDFLEMTREEREVVEMHLAATRELERLRSENPEISQAELARRMGTRQPNVSRLFRNPAGSTLDTVFRALVAFGLDRRKIAALFL